MRRVARSLVAACSGRPGVMFVALVVAAFLARAWLVRGIQAPQFFCDEFIYAEIAKSLAREGHPLLRGHRLLMNGLYPTLIAPAWFARSAEGAYSTAKTINVALMTCTAVPVYLWARRLVPSKYALLAATLTLAMPAFVYTDLLISESAFMPAFVLAVFAMALVLERPTLRRQLFALGAVAVACAARTQGLVLLPLFVFAMALKIAFDVAGESEARLRSVRRGVRSYAWSVALLAAAVVSYVLYKAVQGRALSSGLGPYEAVAQAHYSVGEALRWTLYHFEEMTLATGAFPVTVLVLMLALALRRNRMTADTERSLVALATSALLLLPVEAGLFASRFGDRLTERYTMYLSPLLILVLVVWIARGLPRPKLAAIIAVAIPVAAIFKFPLTLFLGIPVYDSLTPYALLKAAPHLHGANIEWVVRLGAIAVTLGTVTGPRRLAAISLPVLLGAVWVVVAWPTHGFFTTQAAGLRGFEPHPPDWIDRTIGSRQTVSFLYTSGADGVDIASHRLLETEFWNKSLQFVDGTDPEFCELTQRPLSFDAASGRLVSPRGSGVGKDRYLVADQSFELYAEPLARRPPLTLYRVGSSLAVARASQGIFSDGWTGPDASVDFYRPRTRAPGRILLRLAHVGWPGIGLSSATVRVGSLSIDSAGRPTIGRVTDTGFSESKKETDMIFRLRTPPTPFRLEVHIYPAVSQVYVGKGTDPRGLGAVIDVRRITAP